MKKIILHFLIYAFLIAMVIISVMPFIWMILSSFKANKEILAIKQTLFPKVWIFTNYVKMRGQFNFLRFFWNSLKVSGAITLLVVYTSTECGFVLCKYKFAGRDIIFAIVLGTMMLPWAVTIIPRYTLIKSLGWLGSYKAIIIPAMFSSFGIFMMRQSISAVPDEILEAARIDGANEFYILHRIVFPLVKNGISSIAIFQFLWSWEDYLWPYLIITDSKKQLLSVGLKLFNGQYQTDYGPLFAAACISVIPVIIVYVIFQKQFVAGVASSAVKG